MPQTKYNDERALTAFAMEMIAEKGEELSAMEKNKVRRQLMEEANERVENAILAALPDDKLVELGQMMEREYTDAEVEKFFETAGVDFATVAKDALAEMKKEYLESWTNAELVAKNDANRAEFLATAPEGTGYAPGCEPTPEQLMSLEQLAVAGGTI